MDNIRLANVFNFLVIIALMVAISYFIVKKNLLPVYINKISSFVSQHTDKNNTDLKKKISALNKELNLLQKENISLKSKLKTLEKNKAKQKSAINIKALKKHLLKHLPQYEDLFKNKKPNSGVLGGKWIFYDLDVLSGDKVRAYYEDGHINGRINLKYILQDKDTVRWELLDR